jgi:3'-5' exoribonuclease
MTQASAPSGRRVSRRVYIREYQPNTRFSGAFSIMNAQLGTTRAGKPYLRGLLGDKTGDLPLRMWSVSEDLVARIGTEGFVFAEGETQPFQGQLQLIVQRLEPLEDLSDEQMRELLPATEREPGEMFEELLGVLETVQQPAMRALVETYLEDEMLMAQFKRAPAAKALHHARLGGLLEHTLQLVKLADVVCPLYPKISRDLVVVGLFLHDLGKTRELTYERGFGYTDRGELIGHIVDGAIMLHDKAQQMMASKGVRLPEGALTCLQHIILSHHGEPEFGAAKVPATPEAILVSMLDNLDAKTIIALEATRPETAAAHDLGGNFTERQWALRNVKLYKPDPLEDPSDG